MPAIALCFFYDADGQAITQKKKTGEKMENGFSQTRCC